MNQKKRIHLKWDRELADYLSRIQTCELCNMRSASDKAHRLKRRFIGWRTEEDRAEYFMAAKLCRKCHQDLDEGVREDQHEHMFKVITKIIENRPDRKLNGPKVISDLRTWDPLIIYSVR